MTANVFVCLECDVEFKLSTNGSSCHDVTFCPFCAAPIDGDESFEVDDEPESVDDEYEE